MTKTIVTFYPQGHQYIDNFGKVYISVTQLLKRKFPFNQEEILEKIINNPRSSYYKRKREDILDEWNLISQLGTQLHGNCENYVKTKQIEDTIYQNCVKQFTKIVDGNVCTAEKLLWWEELLIAGTADLLIERDNCIEVWDIKTNNKMDDEKVLQYSMQLTFYQIFAKNFFNKEIKVGGIIWFDNFFKNKEKTKMKVIKPIKCIDEVKQLLVERLKEIKK